ncbi:hypothetical protein CKAH01_12305 [Colletotrichum kahawae]|uniref:Uncharacterized protein n=1 Tax=Colletotrichum kahawae TaxID=34407 RepID=A0AAD9YVH6_COLKA|nr:hypothetical protein CKAH01_12305 [Colletotrichum kahawae]
MWQPSPMPLPTSAPWGLTISEADFEKLKDGLEPLDQDDKWRYKATYAEENDTVTIHIIRVGMGHELYSIVIKGGNSGKSGGKNTIETIHWSQDQGGNPISEALAKKHVVILSRCNLECDFEAAPDYDTEDFYDEPAADVVHTVNGINGINGINGTS